MPQPSFWARARQARFLRVLLIYLGAAWLMVQVTDSLRDSFSLPPWVSQVVILLLAAGLIIISATAWVQSKPEAAERAQREDIPGSWEVDLGDVRESVTSGRLPHLTWARSILGGVLAFAVLFAVTAAVVLLRHRIPGVAASDRTMLAVLPFENLGSEEDEYFADGLTEEITARLAAIQRLGLISRTSTLQYKKTTKPIKQIGSELGVDYVLEGTVRWEPASEGARRVRVTPQLIRVSDDSHLWADVYDEDVTGIFAIQSDIAGQVVDALDIRLGDPERRSMEARPTENLEAYDWFLRGNEPLYDYSRVEDIALAVPMFERAVELDPDFALAWARLSRAHTSLYHFFVDRTEERLAQSKRAADEALLLDPDLADAHVALGYWHYQGERDYDRALEELGVALRLQPSNVDALQAIGFVRRRQGRFEEALENIREAARLDPRSGFRVRELGITLFTMGRYDEAEREIERSLTLAPEVTPSHIYAVLLQLARNDLPGATRAAERAMRRAGERSFAANLVTALGVPFSVELLGRDSVERLRKLEPGDFRGDTLDWLLVRAQLDELEGRPDQRAAADSARALLERKLAADPDEAEFHSELGAAYALLGDREAAIREARRGAELLPLTKDALSFAPWRLFLILTRVGETDAAVEELDALMRRPSQISRGALRLHPELEPLRDDPRFRRLLEEDPD